MNLDVFKDRTLLIVDDEPDLRSPLVYEFESLGCRALEASNGKEAFELVQTTKIDVVISDIRMPGGDGIELLKNIKEFHHQCPLVMLITGYSDLSREEVYHLGAEMILPKPFDLDEIALTVAKVLTDPAKRWTQPTELRESRLTITLEFSGLSEAITQGSLRLGRGGVFLPLSEKLFPGEIVGLKLRFADGDLRAIEGVGTVRWIRHENEPDLPKGCGIEFEFLDADASGKLLTYLEPLKVKSFIPKG